MVTTQTGGLTIDDELVIAAPPELSLPWHDGWMSSR